MTIHHAPLGTTCVESMLNVCWLSNQTVNKDCAVVNYNESTMMTSWNENVFRVTGHLCGEFSGHRWFPRTGLGALMFSLICVWINDWVNKREAGDLRRYRAHCDVSVMQWTSLMSIILYFDGLVQDCSNSSVLKWNYCSLALSHWFFVTCSPCKPLFDFFL